MTLWLLYLGSITLALVLSTLLARTRREHRPVALVLTFGLVADLVVGRRGMWGLNLVLTGSPHTGWHLPLYHLSNALVSAWPSALAALAWWVFGTRRIALTVGAGPWLALNAALVARYPFTPEAGQRALLVNEWVALALAGVAIWRRWGRASLGPPQHAARALVVVELVVATVGPFRLDIYRDWDLARFAYLLGFTALAGITVLWLRRPAR